VGVGALDYGAFSVLTFDCYGTLIDWETGIAAAVREQLGAAVASHLDEDLITAFAAVEHEAEVPYKTYREVLALSLRGMGEHLGVEVSDAQAAGFGASVGQWPAFPDSGDALRRLQERFRLAGSYKPDHANFHLAFERIGLPRDRILHVAQSLFHDHVPAKALGMTSVWIDRRDGRGGGASLDVEAHPDARFTSMRAFADDAVPA
jgi:2-haloacid dehalogenase